MANLLVNPSFETFPWIGNGGGIGEWDRGSTASVTTMTDGTFTLSPQAGSRFARLQSSSGTGFIYQKVDLTAMAAGIDAGNGIWSGSAYFATMGNTGIGLDHAPFPHNVSWHDASRLEIRALDSGHTLISTLYDSGEFDPFTNLGGGVAGWVQRSGSGSLPVNTRHVEFRVWGYHHNPDIANKLWPCADNCVFEANATPQTITITAGIASEEAFGAHTVSTELDQTIVVPSIPSEEAFGPATLVVSGESILLTDAILLTDSAVLLSLSNFFDPCYWWNFKSPKREECCSDE